MKKFFAVLLLSLILAPAFAADCSVVSCACVGVIYKDTNLSPPGDLSTRKMSWENAGRRLNRNLGILKPVIVLLFYEQFGLINGPTVYDNDGSNVPWDAMALTFVSANAGERDKLIIGLFDAAPSFGQWDVWTTGDPSNDVSVSTGNALPNGLEVTALTGSDSGALDLSKNQTLITRARNNKFDELRAAILADGC